MSEDPSDNTIGEQQFFPETAYKNYVPLVKAGKGVNGTVYVCMQRRSKSTSSAAMDDNVAVKIWKPSIGTSALPKKRQSASILQKIKDGVAKKPCQHLVALLELDYTDASLPWYSMSVVKGCTFREYLEGYKMDTYHNPRAVTSNYNGNAPSAMYFHALGGCVSAVKWLHGYGLSYRDFNSHNVMLEVHEHTELPRVVLIDLDEIEISLPTVGFKMLGMLFTFMGDIQKAFPAGLPESWEKKLGSVKFEGLKKLRRITGMTYIGELSTRGLKIEPREVLDWVDKVEGFVEGLEQLHDSKTVEEIADVVQSIWKRREDEAMEMAKRGGLAVTYM